MFAAVSTLGPHRRAVIIGFGLASIGADTLSTLASDEDQFCIYKSNRARAFGAAYIILTTVCICTCMSIITTAQIITYQSTRASFTCGPASPSATIVECGLIASCCHLRHRV